MILYKYVDFKDYTKESLTEHYLWLTNPSDLMDSSEAQVTTNYKLTNQQKVDWYKFESLYHFLFTSTENKENVSNLLQRMNLNYEYVLIIMDLFNQESIRLSKYILNNLGSEFFINKISINDKSLISKIDEAIEIQKTKNLDKNEEERRKEEVKNLGICSLTTDNLSTFMWSYYANGNRGFCIGYETLEIEDLKNKFLVPVEDGNKYFNDKYLNLLGNFADAIKVEYAEKNTNFNPLIFNTTPVFNSLYLKDQMYKNEKEYRIVRANINHLPEKEFRKLHFPKEILTTIIFGNKTKQDEIDNLRKLILDNYGSSVKFFKTQFDYDKREISKELIEL